MKKIFAYLLTVGALLMVAGCEEKPTEEAVQSVEWYKEHKSERNDVLTKCRSNPGQLAATPNCINAGRSESATTWSATGGTTPPAAPTFGK